MKFDFKLSLLKKKKTFENIKKIYIGALQCYFLYKHLYFSRCTNKNKKADINIKIINNYPWIFGQNNEIFYLQNSIIRLYSIYENFGKGEPNKENNNDLSKINDLFNFITNNTHILNIESDEKINIKLIKELEKKIKKKFKLKNKKNDIDDIKILLDFIKNNLDSINENLKTTLKDKEYYKKITFEYIEEIEKKIEEFKIKDDLKNFRHKLTHSFNDKKQEKINISINHEELEKIFTETGNILNEIDYILNASTTFFNDYEEYIKNDYGNLFEDLRKILK